MSATLSHCQQSKSRVREQRGAAHCRTLPSSFPSHFLFLHQCLPALPQPAQGSSQHGTALPQMLPRRVHAHHGGNMVPLHLPVAGSSRAAAGTLTGLLGSPAAWEQQRAAEEPLEHDPPTATVYEAGTQVRWKQGWEQWGTGRGVQIKHCKPQ